MRRTVALALLAASSASIFASPIKRTIHPSISPDGQTIAFSYQGDLWTVSAQGGDARRLTVHPAREQLPRWTPDGKQIVFSSDRFGSSDVFKMNRDGSGLVRLTFDSGTETPTAVSPDGQYVYGASSAWGRNNMFRVPLSGGETIRLTEHPLEMAFLPSLTPDGKSIVFCSGGSGGTWRKPNYQGSNSPEIWVGDNTVPVRNMRKLTNNESVDMFPLVANDGSITFVSNRTGWPNVYRMKSDGSGTTALTNLKDGTLRWPTMTPDGKTVVFEFESELYRLEVASRTVTKLAIDAPEDARTNPDVNLTLTTGLTDYAVAPDSKRIAMAIRGDLYLIAERGGPARRLTTNPGNDQLPVWLDPNTVLYTSSQRVGTELGSSDIKRELWTTDMKGNAKRFFAGTKDAGNASVSPDGKWVVFFHGNNDLMLIGADGRGAKSLYSGKFGGAFAGGESANWSPDSKYVAVAAPSERGTDIVLIEAATGATTVVARLARSASPPQFLPNGKGVYFTADEYTDVDLFVVDLVPAEIKFAEDELDTLDAPPSAPTAGSAPPKRTAPKTEIYLPGLEDRMRRLTTTGASGPVASEDGRTIWANVDGQLVAIPTAGGPASPVPGVTGPIAGATLGKGKLYFVQRGGLNALTFGAPGAAPIAFSAQTTLNLRREEAALFDEIWWAMSRFYYDEKMHGKNWAAIKAKFAGVVPFTTDRDDFYALMGEMMEELDSSHLGATPPSSERAPEESTGMLGVEFDYARVANGEYLINRVYEGTPAAHPQSLLKVGDVLVSVNGTTVGKDFPISRALNQTSGRKTRVVVRRDGKDVEVVLRPVSVLARTSVYYDNWVKANRALVDKLSGGQLAYLHYEGMNAPSQQLFLREIRSRTAGKKGVIIDVRFNGGGSTAHEALGVLIKRPWLIRVRRDAPTTKISENIYRGDSLELPSALMTNQYSFSNAEIFSEGFQRLKIGPVVGERTAGGVIGTSALGLWDGGSIRMPAFGAFTLDGENLERNGRKPTFNVLWDPNVYLRGSDAQLEATVRELMKRTK
jgi:tricorn protease